MSATPPVHAGSCHCGTVAFELRATIDTVFDCTCSLCRRRGALWQAAEESQLTLVRGAGTLRSYRFHTCTALHWFCNECGIHPFARPRLDPSRWVVNARCIDALDLQALRIVRFDGANWEAAARATLAGNAPRATG